MGPAPVIFCKIVLSLMAVFSAAASHLPEEEAKEEAPPRVAEAFPP